MQTRSAPALLLAALLIGLAAPAARAQFGDDGYYVPRQPEGGYYRPREAAPRARPERAPRRAYVPQPEPESEPCFFCFGRRQPEYQPQPQYQPQPRQPYQPQRAARPRPERRRVVDERPEPRRTVRPRPRPERPAKAVARAPVVPKPKPEPTTTIAMFGDSLADSVADGLDDAFEDAAGVAIVRRTRGDGGLVRADLFNWPKQVAEYLAAAPKTTIPVIMLGLNDRQPLREGEATHEPLSERWRELYAERVDAVIKPLTERGGPWLWVGTPPMRSEAYSADLAALNALVRERVQRAGGTYVDIWPGFVDDQNRYAMTGPDVEGQVGRLRRPDGIHFTAAGARKAAHFAEIELRRVMEGKGPGEAAPALAAAPSPAAPGAPEDLSAVDRTILAALPALPEPEGLPPIALQRPLTGPVLPLTRTTSSAGGALVNDRPRLDGDAGHAVDRAMRDGVASTPRPGRADDFRWPPRS